MDNRKLRFDPDRLGLVWDEIKIGHRMGDTDDQSIEITEDLVRQFALLTGDLNPIHTDPNFARRTVHRRQIAHGALLYSILLGRYHECGFTYGTTIALMHTTVDYVGRAYFGDRVYAVFEVIEKEEDPPARRGRVRIRSQLMKRGTNDTLIEAEFSALVLRQHPRDKNRT